MSGKKEKLLYSRSINKIYEMYVNTFSFYLFKWSLQRCTEKACNSFPYTKAIIFGSQYDTNAGNFGCLQVVLDL